jgi:hypothetical protein
VWNLANFAKFANLPPLEGVAKLGGVFLKRSERWHLEGG